MQNERIFFLKQTNAGILCIVHLATLCGYKKIEVSEEKSKQKTLNF